ncbi:MAG TPA: hypothetical protein VFS08_04345 [Gemmatimonadaceae bacterium]|nr:hypothetical protein [Gemmatimonadaceae bacterium]
MTRQLTRRVLLAAAVLGTAFLAACSSPTAPSADGCSGTYGGSSTCLGE